MVKGTVTEPAFVEALSKELRRRLKGAEVIHEHVRGNRYRFVVIWKRFDGVGHPERQRQVWDIADEMLEKSDLLNVAMILTVGKREASATA